jgi:hypothetical protein
VSFEAEAKRALVLFPAKQLAGIKAAGLAGILISVFATIPPDLRAARFKNEKADHLTKMVDLLKTVNRGGNAFHSRLQLEGQKMRVVA